MVVIWIVLGIFGVQLLSKLLVRVGLDRQCFGNGEDFEQKWELLLVFLGDFATHECLIVTNEIQ